MHECEACNGRGYIPGLFGECPECEGSGMVDSDIFDRFDEEGESYEYQ